MGRYSTFGSVTCPTTDAGTTATPCPSDTSASTATKPPGCGPRRGAGKVVNPHTFLSISASIAQVNNIARELGKLDPDNAKAYTQNARAYGKRLRQMRADALAKLTSAPNPDLRVATAAALVTPPP